MRMTLDRRFGSLVRRNLRHRIAAFFTCLVLAGFVLAEESWGQSRLPRVGIIVVDAIANAPATGDRSEVILQALANEGWVDGQNVAVEVRNARGNPPRFDEAAAELVRLQVDIILADSAPALRAAISATSTIPIVAGDYTTDPIAMGYIKSYAHPGRNVTGVFLDAPEFSGTWLDLLKEIVPGLSRVAVLWDPAPGDAHLRALKVISPSFGIELQVIEVRNPEDIDMAGAEIDGRTQALIVLPSPMTYAENVRLAELAAKVTLPAVSIFPAFAVAGGAFAYGPEQISEAKRMAALVSKILRGARPADLPIERPTKYQLVVNLDAVRQLGITIPQSILLRADEVIR